VVLRAKLSNLFNKMVREMTILTDFGNLHISSKYKDILAKKNYPVVYVIPLAIYHKNMSEIDFRPLPRNLRFV